jgi:GT2 family glycosyltransferase
MIPPPPKIGVVVLNFNCAEDTLGCLESLRQAPCGEMRAWVVDNASGDGSAEKIPPRLREDEVWLLTGENLGYAGGNNAGIREALRWGADYALVVNPDCRVEKGFLQHLVRALEAQPWGGAACPKILDRDTGRVQSIGGTFNLSTGRAARRFLGAEDGSPGTKTWTTVDYPMGACVLFKRTFLEEVGLFNEGYFLYYEDTEMGLRARREGWTTLAIPQSCVSHGDTTSARFGNPVVSYHGTRNQAWVVRQYGRMWHRVTFFALCLLLRWPLRFAARFLTGKFRAAWAVVRGAWAGTFLSGFNGSEHLAVPIGGRPGRTDAYPTHT